MISCVEAEGLVRVFQKRLIPDKTRPFTQDCEQMICRLKHFVHETEQNI